MSEGKLAHSMLIYNVGSYWKLHHVKSLVTTYQSTLVQLDILAATQYSHQCKALHWQHMHDCFLFNILNLIGRPRIFPWDASPFLQPLTCLRNLKAWMKWHESSREDILNINRFKKGSSLLKARGAAWKDCCMLICMNRNPEDLPVNKYWRDYSKECYGKASWLV